MLLSQYVRDINDRKDGIMLKINDEKKGKDYLVDVHDTLYRLLNYDKDFFAMAAVVDKMFYYDIELGTKWATDLLNRYGVQGLADYKNNFDYDSNVRGFIEAIIETLEQHYSMGDIIKLFHKEIHLGSVRHFLWVYLFHPYNENNGFLKYLDVILKKGDYETAFKIISMVLECHDVIDHEVFDPTNFLLSIIEKYTKKKIEDKKLLDFLYSLVQFDPTDFGKAVLKSCFVDYI